MPCCGDMQCRVALQKPFVSLHPKLVTPRLPPETAVRGHSHRNKEPRGQAGVNLCWGSKALLHPLFSRLPSCQEEAVSSPVCQENRQCAQNPFLQGTQCPTSALSPSPTVFSGLTSALSRPTFLSS